MLVAHHVRSLPAPLAARARQILREAGRPLEGHELDALLLDDDLDDETLAGLVDERVERHTDVVMPGAVGAVARRSADAARRLVGALGIARLGWSDQFKYVQREAASGNIEVAREAAVALEGTAAAWQLAALDAVCLLAEDRPEAALDACERALVDDPERPELHRLATDAAKRARRTAAALRHARWLVDHCPRDAVSWRHLGEAHALASGWPDAPVSPPGRDTGRPAGDEAPRGGAMAKWLSLWTFGALCMGCIDVPGPVPDPLEEDDAEAPFAEPAVGAGDGAPVPPAPVDADAAVVFELDGIVHDERWVRPLDVVALNAADLLGGLGREPTTWTVVARPAGSTARPVESIFDPARPADGGPADDPATPGALLFVDLAGDYELHLRLPARGDRLAAIVVLHAVPDQDIHVQLVWDTPGDPDQTDADGSDVDLHLLHPRGLRWMAEHYDCHFANARPDWGPPGARGDPSLDIDDVNGAGPENINLEEPEDTAALGAPYRVGVHYYRAENRRHGGTWGPSVATVRVYLRGALAGEWTRRLEETGALWEVAHITWGAEGATVVGAE